MWKDENDQDDFFTEEQLMEDFTFKVAKRRLGLQIDMEEGKDLFENNDFTVYQINNTTNRMKSVKENSKKVDWKWMISIAVMMIVAKIVFRIVFNKN